MTEQKMRLEEFVSRGVLDSAPTYARAFQEGQPFRHIVIDDFLTLDFCQRIHDQFPGFDTEYALNENKQVGAKATREEVRSLGPAFIEVDDLVKNPDFLALIERITGVDGLNYDPHYFGGGTHENRAGQDLDPHIDFNFHPVSNQHRRLNLIIYLNEEWNNAWGGALQLHRDPCLEPAQDEIVTVTPLMNRCVIFETSEDSWHGFERIVLPDDKSHLSRKSFAVYFYTDTRPVKETADVHSTVYVERHLPERFMPGMTLDDSDIWDIKQMLLRRDQHLKRLYGDIRNLGGELSLCRRSAADTTPVTPEVEMLPENASSTDRMIRILRNRINELESSTSWWLTAPLRAFKRLITGKSQ